VNTGSGLADCRILDKDGVDAVPGVNCQYPPRLLEWIGGLGHPIPVVVAELALEAPSGTKVPFMECRYGEGFVTQGLNLTATITLLDDLGSSEVPSQGVFWDACTVDDYQECPLFGGMNRSYFSDGAYLVFLARSCCLDKWRPNLMNIVALYPVVDGSAYDWDGAGVSIEDVRTALAKLRETPASGYPIQYELPCPADESLVSVEVFSSRSEYEARDPQADSGRVDSQPQSNVPTP